MKKYRNTLYRLLILMMITYSCQDSVKKTEYTKDLEYQLKDLKEATTEDMVRLSPIKWDSLSEPDFYTTKGESLKRDEFHSLSVTKQYQQVFFLNDKDQVKAVVLEPLSNDSKRLTQSVNKKQVEVGQLAPVFTVEDLNGNSIDLATLKGKVVVLNFWFINCPPCRKEIPDLNRLTEDYKDKNVVFIAISDDSEKRLTKFFKKHPFAYQQVSSNSIKNDYGIRSFPTNIVLDKDSRVVFNKIGGRSDIYDLIQEEIEKYL